MKFWSYGLAQILLWPIMKLVGRVEIIGQENIPATGGVIVCANHVSYVDPPVLGWAAPRPLRFMAKAELFDIPILGRIVRNYAFPVHRGAADRTALKTAISIIKSGHAVAIFPEGTLSPDGILLEPSAGVGMIILHSHAVVIPCALIDTEAFLPPHHWLLKFCRVKVVFGEPIEYADLQEHGGRTAQDEISKRIMSSIGDLLKTHRALS